MIVEILKSFSKYNAGEKFHFSEAEVEILVKRGLAKLWSEVKAVEAQVVTVEEEVIAKFKPVLIKKTSKKTD